MKRLKEIVFGQPFWKKLEVIDITLKLPGNIPKSSCKYLLDVVQLHFLYFGKLFLTLFYVCVVFTYIHSPRSY